MLCYHGTNADNLLSILENGIVASPNSTNWVYSGEGVFCWSKNYIQLEYPEYEENQEEWHEILLSQAMDYSGVTLGKSKDCRGVVIVFDIPESEIDDDYSADGMEMANCIHRDIKPEEIKEIYISEDLSLFRPAFIVGMMGRALNNIEFTPIERKVAQKVGHMLFDCFGCLSEFNWNCCTREEAYALS